MSETSTFWLTVLLGSFGFLFILSLFFPSANIFFHLTVFLKKRNRKIEFNAEYYRDILSYTPSELLYIYDKDYREDYLDSYLLIKKYQKLFYINVLKMNLLKYVNINFDMENDFEIIKNDVLILDKEYKMIYDYIFGVITNDDRILLSDIEKYVEENYEDNSFFEKWHQLISKDLSYNGFYSASVDFLDIQGDMLKVYYICVISILSVIEIYLLITMTGMGIICLFVFPLLLVIGYFESKDKIEIETNKAVYEYKKVMALKRFLEDFTIIEERTADYIKLLEDYVVYAAIFDMYDKSLKEKLEEIREFISSANK